MVETRSIPVEFVTTSEQLASLLTHLSNQGRIALDTESNSLHRYPERVCLLQIATQAGAYLIDPLAVEDMSPLGEVLANASVQKVMHAAEQDIRWLARDWGFRTCNIYDTSIAARFIGESHLGLGNLLSGVLGLSIEKDPRLQKSDWGRRPLKEDAVAYAVADVEHLFALQDALDRQLEMLGRSEWVAEEFARLDEVRHTPPDHETAFLAMKGSGRLEGRELAILKCLHEFRESEAIRQRRPPYFILPTEALVYLAAHPDAALAEAPGIVERTASRFAGPLKRAIRQGRSAPLIKRKPGLRAGPMNAAQLDRFIALRQWRSEEATRLNLDAGLIWPKASLERLARSPHTFEQEVAEPRIMQWRVEQFGEAIKATLAAL